MKILFIHSDYLEYEAKEKLRFAEEVKEKKHKIDECLVVFTAVEKNDEKNPGGVVKNAVREIKDVSDKVKTKRIVIYPYAHLSSSLASPENAKNILAEMEESLEGYDVVRAPFGWYKSFKLSCKGHPLSELSREITAEEKKETAEKKIKSYLYVLTPDGRLTEAEKFDFKKYEELKIIYEYEKGGTRTISKEPRHVELMQKMEFVDYEPASDPGNLRWYPKGELIKKLLERHVTNICLSHNAMQVETPIMYDYKHPALSKYLEKFPARQYIVKSEEKEYFLRFAACFGQYLIAHDAKISYKALPVKFYELTHYSFRREQRGELTGLKRLRAFTMPDMHTLCMDMDQAKNEFKSQFLLSMEWMESLNLEYEAVLRFVRSFYDENKDIAAEIAKKIGKPVLVEMWDEKYFYFVTKFEFNISDSQKKCSALSTVQIDVENSERFDITYVDKNGEKKYPLILHASISGGVDRCLYAILEHQAKRIEKGEKPELPFWLAPTQIRIIPVSDEFLEDCEKIADQMNARIDIDDREEKISRKIRDAEKEWISMIIVYGEKEKKSKTLPVRKRTSEIKNYSLEELKKEVEKSLKDYPYAPLPLPVLLSKRIGFRG